MENKPLQSNPMIALIVSTEIYIKKIRDSKLLDSFNSRQ